MNDVRSQIPGGAMPYSIGSVWAMLPAAYENMRETLSTIPPDRLAAAASMPADTANPPGNTGYSILGGVAVVPFSGVVSKRQTLMGRIFGGQAVTTQIGAAVLAAEADPAVEKILLVIDSPGGSVDGTSALADIVDACTKPTVAYCEDLCCSAAYWVASQADTIACNSTATVGSIGCFATVADMSRLAANAGVDMKVVRSAGGKGGNVAGAPVTDAHLTDMQTHVNAIAAEFTAAVSKGRGFDASALADGRVHIGAAAVKLGLVDSVSSLSAVLAAMQEPEPDFIDPSEHTEPAEAVAEAPQENVMAETPEPKVETPAPTVADTTVADLSAIRAELAGMKHAAAITQGVADRKLTPALVKAAHGMPYDTLVAWIADLPVSAPAGGSVTTTTTVTTPEPAAGHPADHVGGFLHAYTKETGPAHAAAIAYMDRSERAGRKASYREAVVAVSRRTSAA
jgi:signal peptide peptidase SppA